MNKIIKDNPVNKNKVINGFQDELAITSAIVDARQKCRCGHTQLVVKRKDKEFDLCTYCNGRLYGDKKQQIEYEKRRDKEEFIYNLKRCLGVKSEGIMKYD